MLDFLDFTFLDILDIVLVAVLLYYIYKLLKGTVAINIFLGIAFNWGVLLAFAASTNFLNWPCIILYFAGISWTLFYDTIYAHQDKEDDALLGVKSTAILFADRTKIWLFLFETLEFLIDEKIS